MMLFVGRSVLQRRWFNPLLAALIATVARHAQTLPGFTNHLYPVTINIVLCLLFYLSVVLAWIAFSIAIIFEVLQIKREFPIPSQW